MLVLLVQCLKREDCHLKNHWHQEDIYNLLHLDIGSRSDWPSSTVAPISGDSRISSIDLIKLDVLKAKKLPNISNRTEGAGTQWFQEQLHKLILF